MATDTEAPDTPTATAAPRKPLRLLAVGAFALVVIVVAVVALTGGTGSPEAAPVTEREAQDAVAGVDPITAALPVSTTFTTVDGAPTDATPENATDGLVVHPRRETPVHDAPGGRPLARMPRTMFDDVGNTWLPVIEQQAGWVRVLLPSRPNGATGWIRSADVDDARTPYVINVHLRSMELQLVQDGRVTDAWTVGIGRSAAPTPVGRTFLMGAITDPQQTFSEVLLPLGTHSPTLDSFGGGPGTVAIHTWPTADVYGRESSDGCIRVPPDALKKLTGVPLGTLVMITDD